MLERRQESEPTLKDGYIPAPYELEEGDCIRDAYLEPVIYHNDGGPDIGVTTCGVIVQDGLYFKDMDNDGVLSPYEDWRLSAEERAADMVSHLRLDQQAGLVLNNLWNNPVVRHLGEATDENGNVIVGKVMPAKGSPEALNAPSFLGMESSIDDSNILEKKLTAGVYRLDMAADASMVALYHNVATQMLEHEACQGGVAIPFSLHTNPINIGYPDQLGIGAAVLGDGSADLVFNMADTDRKMMKAAGLDIMYGPQVDVATDPRWPRISGTYGECVDATSAITDALIRGYQHGGDGLNEESVVLTVKHFPGDGPSENGFEPHVPIGQWRLYPTEGSLEKYHLPPFQAAFDAKASAIMPDYSRPTKDGRSVEQAYHGHVTSTEEVPSTYNKGLITELARDVMGFDGYVNSDSGIIYVQNYGLEDESVPARYAKAISAGTDVIGGPIDPENIVKAVEEGLLPKKDLDRANYRRLLSMFRTKRVDNPYLDIHKADQARHDNLENAKRSAYAANQKAVVLAKNHNQTLPLAAGAKVYVCCLKGDDPGLALAQAMGAAAGGGDVDEFQNKIEALFEQRGFTVVDTPEEADFAYLHVWPILNNIVFNQTAMSVLQMGENIEVEAREANKSQQKTGEILKVSTLHGVERIASIAHTVHESGGKVIATLVVNNPWLLDTLEPYVDALTMQYTVSGVAMDNALNAQLDVLTGAFAPTGKMPLTMVSSPDVIAISEREIDGHVREVCASPNDVPGIDKDRYIDPEILANVPGGSYAHQDADGNYYRAGFGLTY